MRILCSSREQEVLFLVEEKNLSEGLKRGWGRLGFLGSVASGGGNFFVSDEIWPPGSRKTFYRATVFN